MPKKLLLIILISCISLAGCASPRILLTRGQKNIDLKPGEGGVLFSLATEGSTKFTPVNLALQEINQYKNFNEKKLEIVPISSGDSSVNKSLFLFSLKLPKGTYRISHLFGTTGVIIKANLFLPCDNVIDVYDGKITYAGCIEYKTFQGANSIFSITDNYNADLALFVEHYPAIQGRNIKKDLMY